VTRLATGCTVAKSAFLCASVLLLVIGLPGAMADRRGSTQGHAAEGIRSVPEVAKPYVAV
jgi:hypothetical protein